MFGVNNEVNLKPSKHKIAQVAQAIPVKNEPKSLSDSIVEDSDSYARGIMMEKPMMRQKRPKVQKQLKFSEDNVC